MNSKLHAVCDGQGRPLVMLLTEGQTSGYRGAHLMLPHLPPAKELLADKGYDADWLRRDLAEGGIKACIPARAKRKNPVPHDATLCRQRHKIEIVFDTFVEQHGDVVRMTRLPEELVFDPMPTRETASLGDLLEGATLSVPVTEEGVSS